MSKSDYNHNITFGSIVSGIRSTSTKTLAKRQATKAIKSYIEIMFNTVLEGYEWDIPGLGVLCIYKNELQPGQLPNASRVETLKNKKRTLSLNPRRLNQFYSIELTSGLIEKSGMEFKACATFRQRLNKILRTTAKQYRSK